MRAALEARLGGVRLFTADAEHLGVAALTTTGRIYRAAGADDAAFHYRFPVGAALQQAATYRDYFVQAVVVAGPAGRLPRLRYRDRQYGYEGSSFYRKRGLAPIRLILVQDAPGADPKSRRYRMTTFEEALPGAFSAPTSCPTRSAASSTEVQSGRVAPSPLATRARCARAPAIPRRLPPART